MLKKNYTWLMLSVLLGALVLLQNGCAWTVSGYSRYPYYYNNYYWYPYGGYNWRPYYYYDRYYWYPYGGYSWWPYRSYSYRDHRYHYSPRDRHDDGYRIGPPPRRPQSPPPGRKPYPFKPDQPRDGKRPPLDRPFLRDGQQRR